MARLNLKDSIINDLDKLHSNVREFRNEPVLDSKIKKMILKIDMALWDLEQIISENSQIFADNI